MKNLIFRKNIIANKKAGGAMIVLMLVFFVIFILAFGSGYLVFMNTSKSVDVSNGIKARYAALAGKDRALYEAMKNNYDFAGNCSSNIFQKTLADGSSYIISCVDNSGNKSFFSTGKYKNVEISLEIDCINIEKDCLESCDSGSICGGGKLLKTATHSLIVSPSNCGFNGLDCDNGFSIADTINFRWDSTGVYDFQCGNTYTDYRDSQQYPTVQIGSQCWMAKNMNYNDGCASSSWINEADARWCGCFNNVSGNCAVHGKLYQWSAAMAGASVEKSQGICPKGWHVPSSAEFNTLVTYLGGSSVAGGKLKQAGTAYWASPNTGATNESGFNALASGRRNTNGSGLSIYSGAYFWSSSPSTSLTLSSASQSSTNAANSQVFGFSVRCLMNSTTSLPAIVYNNADSSENGKINNINIDSQNKSHLEAAKYCDDLTVNGYSDWYLPATNELAALRSDASFSYFNLQSVSGDEYWTSTEQGSSTPTMAGYIKMSTGVSSNANKISEFKVRCIRKDHFCSAKTICGETCSYGGEDYETIQIGAQCWFKRNLNYDNGCSTKTWINGTDVGWCGCYEDKSKNCTIYGRLYQWKASMNGSIINGAQGVCPPGWHVPKDSEIATLGTNINNNVSYRCNSTTLFIGKAMAANNAWTPYTSTVCAVGNVVGTNNASGFNIKSSGFRRASDGAYINIGTDSYIWSSTISGSNALVRRLFYASPYFLGSTFSQSDSYPVRCLKD